MHLQGAVTTTQRNTPFAVTQQLDLIVAGLFDIQLDQNILVFADSVCLDLVQYLANHGRSFSSGLGNRLIIGLFQCQQGGSQKTLPFAAATTNSLDTEAALGILLKQLRHLSLYLGTQFINGKQIDTLGVGGHQDMIGQGLDGKLTVGQDLFIAGQSLGFDQLDQLIAGRIFFE